MTAVLKIQFPHRETEHEAHALALCNGDEAVRLLDHDSNGIKRPGFRGDSIKPGALQLDRLRPCETRTQLDLRAASHSTVLLVVCSTIVWASFARMS